MQQSDGLYKQNNNFTRTSRFKVVNTTKNFQFFYTEIRFFSDQTPKISPALYKVWSMASLLF